MGFVGLAVASRPKGGLIKSFLVRDYLHASLAGFRVQVYTRRWRTCQLNS